MLHLLSDGRQERSLLGLLKPDDLKIIMGKKAHIRVIWVHLIIPLTFLQFSALTHYLSNGQSYYQLPFLDMVHQSISCTLQTPF